VNAGEREIVLKKEGGKKGSTRGSVHWGCDYATAVDVEVDPQRRRFGRRESDFALQAWEKAARRKRNLSELSCDGIPVAA
jgi:hypothetical protein